MEINLYINIYHIRNQHHSNNIPQSIHQNSQFDKNRCNSFLLNEQEININDLIICEIDKTQNQNNLIKRQNSKMKFASPTKQGNKNQYQSNQLQYEQQFWKLKAQRLQAKCQQLNKEIQSLLKKITQGQKRQQQLNDKIILLQASDFSKSHKKDDKKNIQQPQEKINQSIAYHEELERLTKQIRTLKSGQSLQISKATQQSKRLKKKVVQLQTKLTKMIPNQQHTNQMKKLHEQIGSMIKKQLSNNQQLQRLKQQKKKLLQDNNNLRKQVQLLNAKSKAAQKQQQQNLIDRRKYQKIFYQYKSQAKPTAQIILQSQSSQYKQQSQWNIKNIMNNLQKQQDKNNKIMIQKIDWQNQKLRLENKLKQYQYQLTQSKQQLKNILIKLSPLLTQKKQNQHKYNIQQKASITLLEILLQKHKIQIFN